MKRAGRILRGAGRCAPLIIASEGTDMYFGPNINPAFIILPCVIRHSSGPRVQPPRHYFLGFRTTGEGCFCMSLGMAAPINLCETHF